MVYMFLNGEGMRGGRVHHHIAGTPFVGERRTAAKYRFYSVRDEFPGLWPASQAGYGIDGEVYDVPLEMLRDELLPDEPPELELGIVELADGVPALSMVLRRAEYESGTHRDISAYGGWRAYRSRAADG